MTFAVISLGAHAAVLVAVAWPRPPPPPRPIRIEVLLVPPRADRLVSPRAGPQANAPAPSRGARSARVGPSPRPHRAQRRPAAAAAPLAPTAAPEIGLEPAASASVPPEGAPRFAGDGATAPTFRPSHLTGEDGLETVDAAPDDLAWLRTRRREILRRVQLRINADPYPRMAELRGWTGLVRVALTIDPDGAASRVEVEESSGHAVLDRAAVDAVREAAPYPRPPRPLAIVIPVRFVLR